jgi:hypothetical protein
VQPKHRAQAEGSGLISMPMSGPLAAHPVEHTKKGVAKVMDASHVLVGGLTAISITLLVWIEVRSRRNSAAQEQNPVPDGTTATKETKP